MKPSEPLDTAVDTACACRGVANAEPEAERASVIVPPSFRARSKGGKCGTGSGARDCHRPAFFPHPLRFVRKCARRLAAACGHALSRCALLGRGMAGRGEGWGVAWAAVAYTAGDEYAEHACCAGTCYAVCDATAPSPTRRVLMSASRLALLALLALQGLRPS